MVYLPAGERQNGNSGLGGEIMMFSRREAIKSLAAGTFACAFGTGIASATEVQVFSSGETNTDDFHERHCPTGGPDTRSFANACFKKYTLTIETGGGGWAFVGEPWIELVGPVPNQNPDEAQAAFNWNNFAAAHDRVYATERNADRMVVICWAGSHPMVIKASCRAQLG
jgi:hypothetical protein